MMKVTLAAAVLVAAVSAPSHSAEESFALKTALFLQLTDPNDGPLRDLKRSELPQELRGAPDPTLDSAVRRAFSAADAVSAVGRVGSALPGVSFDAIAGVSTLVFLFGPEKLHHPATQRHFIAYAPRSVGDRKAAMDVVKRAMEESLVKAYQSQGYEVAITEKRTEGLFGGLQVQRLVALTGGEICGKAYGCRLMISTANNPKEVDKAPWFLPASESGYYAWKNWRWGDKGMGDRNLWAHVIATELDDPEDLRYPGNAPQVPRQVVLAATAHMPDWMFVYEPAGKDVRYPAFFRRGEEKLFVEPLTAATE